MLESVGLVLAIFAAGDEVRLQPIRQELRHEARDFIETDRRLVSRLIANGQKDEAIRRVQSIIRRGQKRLAAAQKELADVQQPRGNAYERAAIYWQEYVKAYQQWLEKIQAGALPAEPKKKK
jgi:hypothetical protein